ncbi:hypothetical protein Goari_014451 [Gossypium aridum]|uniref:Uncharacterized protein n=1 Tax=Gossypium aridum TaxID=34290 RepID=A0A7J8XHX5_GOSAI|nr:hypothetical protein [Gossypium aridum]
MQSSAVLATLQPNYNILSPSRFYSSSASAAATFLPVFYPQRTRFSAPQYLKLDKQVLASASGRYVHEVKSPFKNAAVLSDSYRFAPLLGCLGENGLEAQIRIMDTVKNSTS